MRDLTIKVDERSFPTRVVVRGDLDLEGGDALEAALLPRLRRGARVEVVCEGIEFADSSGLAALIAADQRAEEVGAHLVLCDPSPRLLTVLHVTGTRDLFSIEGGADLLAMPVWSR
jgi:anti-sigma B factor antagonist